MEDQLCAICDKEIGNHDILFINGTEAYACYGAQIQQEELKSKLTKWLEERAPREHRDSNQAGSL